MTFPFHHIPHTLHRLLSGAATTVTGLRSLCCCATAAIILAACSGIAEEDRLIYVKQPDAQRAVLIEDFTGQRCINCPNAAAKIEQLKEEYGADKIIAVGIHSGPLAVFSRGKILGLRTQEGDEYYERWSIQEEPTGYINRSGDISTIDKWDKLVREAVQKSTPVTIDAVAVMDTETRAMQLQIKASSNLAMNAKLQLWITESDIVAQQMMPDGSQNPNYVHNHVFRASVNGTWGTDINMPEGDLIVKEFDYQVPEEWNADNLNLVAFIYDNSGVLQVCEAPVHQTKQE